MPEGAALGPSQQETEAVAQGQAFQCPRCGGRMSFSVSKGLVTCEYCGYEQEMAPSEASGPVADLNEKVLDFVMPTTRGHCWAEAQHRLSCERCGALSILPPGQKTLQCAYCGSNQLVESSQDVELLDPQVIGLVKIDAAEAARRVRQWLGKGLFTPDTLVRAWQHVRLQPAYYSFWTFDGTVELNWSCEVAEGSGNSKHWTPRSGVEMRFFNDVLVSGVKALSEREQDSIEPFNLVDVEEFQPEYLAGWPAILYDRPLSEASLLGRQKVVKQMRSQLNDLVEIGYEKRNLKIGGGSWSGMTYKHILLPIWIGAYPFQGKDYQVLVNGQTGKVGGSKPRDKLTLVFAFLTTLMFAFLIVVIYWLISGREFPF
jgi:transcription elongation factor Elf1